MRFEVGIYLCGECGLTTEVKGESQDGRWYGEAPEECEECGSGDLELQDTDYRDEWDY